MISQHCFVDTTFSFESSLDWDNIGLIMSYQRITRLSSFKELLEILRIIYFLKVLYFWTARFSRVFCQFYFRGQIYLEVFLRRDLKICKE